MILICACCSFGQQASESHDYPLSEMRKIGPGEHVKKMLVCQVACGKIFKTLHNYDTLKAALEGYDSVHQSTGAKMWKSNFWVHNFKTLQSPRVAFVVDQG